MFPPPEAHTCLPLSIALPSYHTTRRRGGLQDAAENSVSAHGDAFSPYIGSTVLPYATGSFVVFPVADMLAGCGKLPSPPCSSPYNAAVNFWNVFFAQLVKCMCAARELAQRTGVCAWHVEVPGSVPSTAWSHKASGLVQCQGCGVAQALWFLRIPGSSQWCWAPPRGVTTLRRPLWCQGLNPAPGPLTEDSLSASQQSLSP